MLFVDGGNNAVGIGTDTPTGYPLQVEKTTSGGGAGQDVISIAVGSETSPAADEGGGIDLKNDSSPTIVDCIITNVHNNILGAILV